jgi:hypothetical protein
MLPDLSSLLNYSHEKVIKSYIRTYSVDDHKASELFSDMLRYLWISRKHSLDRKHHPDQEFLKFQLVMHEEMRNIDNMWHNFILYTQDYTQFCIQYFGEYLHHMPDVAETMLQTDEEFSMNLERYLSYVYDHLGEETIHRWFSVHLV